MLNAWVVLFYREWFMAVEAKSIRFNTVLTSVFRTLRKRQVLRKILPCLLLFIVLASSASAQKVESIHFNLYTDSLKKGFFNYINIDGKMSDGNWMPLDSTEISFSSNAGFFKGNDLFIDSAFRGEKVKVRAALKSDPKVYKEITIYIRKRGFDEPLQTSQEIINDMMEHNRKRKKERQA